MEEKTQIKKMTTYCDAVSGTYEQKKKSNAIHSVTKITCAAMSAETPQCHVI